jgi:hypothetical protein
MDRTLGAQSDQLDKTLAEQYIRTLNERFATAAEQLGSDKPAVRLAGVYAMAVLADDWEKNRQACVDVLCAYLRMPYQPDPGRNAPEPEQLAFRTSREVTAVVDRDPDCVAAGHSAFPGGASRWPYALVTDGRTCGKAGAAAVIMPVCGTDKSNGSRWRQRRS